MNLFKKLFTVLSAFPQMINSQDSYPAEFAIRWNPEESSTSLHSVDAILKALDLKAENSKRDEYAIDYYDIQLPEVALSPNVVVIARKRIKNAKKYQLMVKYRSAMDLNTLLSINEWNCPLADFFPDLDVKTKYETDIAFGESGTTAKTYSLSCTVESKDAIEFPARFSPKIQSNPKKMSRIEVNEIKIDQIVDEQGKVLMEVSTSGMDAPNSIDRFYKEFAFPLLSENIKPILTNKANM